MIVRILFVLMLLSSFPTWSQFDNYVVKEGKKQLFQFVSSKNNQVLFDKCSSIKSINGSFPETDSSFRRFALIKQKKNLIIFDTKDGKTVETIKHCDSLSFYEIEDYQRRDSVNSEVKKKVIFGKTYSSKQKYNQLDFLLNVVTTKTKGFYPKYLELTVKYDLFHEKLIHTILDYKWLDSEDFNLQSLAFNQLFQLDNGDFLLKHSKTELYGVLDRNLEEVIPFKYHQLQFLDTNLLMALNQNMKIGFINNKGITLIPFVYDCFEKGWGFSCNESYRSLGKDYFLMRQDREKVVVNKMGEVIIPKGKYWSVSSLNDTLAYIYSSSRSFGIYDLKNKKELVPCEFDWSSLNGCLLLGERNGRVGMLDICNNKTIVPFVYTGENSHFMNESGKYYILETAGRKGVLSAIGEIIIPFIYDDLTHIKGYLLIKQRGLFGLFDAETFEDILPIEFSKIDVYNRKVEKYEEDNLLKGRFTQEGEVNWE